jgi:hypothetical protein
MKERDQLKNPGIHRRIILKWILGKRFGVYGFVSLPQGRDQWWALTNIIMNVLVPKSTGNFLTS